MAWFTCLRNTCFKLVLSQGEKWFERSDYSPMQFVQVLIEFFVVAAMLGVGFVWALVHTNNTASPTSQLTWCQC